ncbi:MAG: hypothetical protein M1826_004953 [Phylliscum demangeonii]|nr:MAG: hypothetical protein M1826_004953 [Phylliscum demangeonii]
MSSFFGKLRGNNGSTSPSNTSSPSKKDAGSAPHTPLGKLLDGAGPLRDDGSDKFFGMENFGNSCYCNSVLQCLYYSTPFREQVIAYPARAPSAAAPVADDGPPPLHINTGATTANGVAAPSAPARANLSVIGSGSSRRGYVASHPGPSGLPRPEEKADSAEFKKKQAMMAGPVLSMDGDNAASYGMSESLFTSLKDIFEAIVGHRSRQGVVSPQRLLEIVKRENEMFRTSMHQDAHEFLNFLLNEVMANVEANASKQDAANTKANANADVDGSPSSSPPRWVHDLFEGTLTSETRCLTCENTSSRDEAFLDLSVDLDQHSSVTSCLRKFSEEEMLCERNKFHCDNCGGLQEAEKRMKIKRLPRILALHLKRFKYTEDLQRLQKLFYRVVYPYHLRLFNTTDDAEDPDRLYELYAVVVHIGGGPYHGHYVSVIKTPDRGWLLFDDELVEPVDQHYVRNFFGDRPGLACAYVLFYQQTTLEAVRREQEASAAAPKPPPPPGPKNGVGLKPNGVFRRLALPAPG